MFRATACVIAFCCLCSNGLAIGPIAAVKATPNKAAFKASKATAPIVLKSKDDAKKYFDEKNLKTVLKGVDFSKQIVLVFAWRGSGRDNLSHVVAESFPEQVFFTYKRGRTRDLRTHTHVYALRSNVKWRVR